MNPPRQRRSIESYYQQVAKLLTPVIQSRLAAGARPAPVSADCPGELVALLGRHTAGSIRAETDFPFFTNSQMDGYALHTADVASTPDDDAAGADSLVVDGVIPAGCDPAAAQLRPGHCWAVMTGSALPADTAAVVAVEACTPGNFAHGVPARISINQRPRPGQFLRAAGSDLRAGEEILASGARLHSRNLGLLAALGVPAQAIPVAKTAQPENAQPKNAQTQNTLPKSFQPGNQPVTPLRVLVISTGDELVAPGQVLRPGQIYDANTTLVAATLAEYGVQAHAARVLGDEVESFTSAFTQAVAAAEPDWVITTGGVSAGAFDVVKAALNRHGLDFTSVAMQPGGPQGCGIFRHPEIPGGGVPVVALPGNPVSAWVSLEMFLRPLLVHCAVPAPASPSTATAAPNAPAGGMGGLLQPRRRFTARLELAEGEERIDSPAGLRQIRRARLVPNSLVSDSSAPQRVTLTSGPSSHLLAGLAAANALVIVDEHTTQCSDGDEVTGWVIE